MPELRVHLFGRFRIQSAGGLVAGFEAGRVQELFAFLLLAHHAHSREALADVLWGSTAGLRARKALRQALWQLQSALDNQSDGSARVIVADADWVSINPLAHVWLDLEVFEDAARSLDGVHGSTLSPEHAQRIRDAVELHTDPLLPGCYQEWCLIERERLEQLYIGMLDKLMAYSQTHQAFELGLHYGELILGCDRARERTHRRMMRLRYLSGDRTGALRQYERCVAALRKELDVAPSGPTRRLYEDLRADRVDAPVEHLVDESGPAWTLTTYVGEVVANLAFVQHLIQQETERMQVLQDRLRQH